MDSGTYVIFFSAVISVVVIVATRLIHLPRVRALGASLIAITSVWLFISAFGEFLFTWAGNSACSKYMGCVSGFFGYDAYEHLFFGVALVLALVWVSDRFPKYSILHGKRWKTVIEIIAMVALVAVLWEIVECMHDAFRADFLHEPLRNLSLHINLLDQPTNLDTMGDLVFSLLGAGIGLFL